MGHGRNSVAEINRFESFDGTVTETEVPSVTGPIAAGYLFRQTVSK